MTAGKWLSVADRAQHSDGAAPRRAAARYGVIERTDPLGPAAIDRVRQLRRDLPALTRAAGSPAAEDLHGAVTHQD